MLFQAFSTFFYYKKKKKIGCYNLKDSGTSSKSCAVLNSGHYLLEKEVCGHGGVARVWREFGNKGGTAPILPTLLRNG